MITADAMRPFGLALKDFYAGDVNAEVIVRRSDGEVSLMAVSAFFRGPLDFQVDKILLDICRGKILDVGAGAGIHSLYLQQKGFDVTALDVSPEACEVMKRRGVAQIICSSITDLKTGGYDTILMLGRSICMVETLSGLEDFLRDARGLVHSEGRILLNSLDVSQTGDRSNFDYHELNRKAGRYIGEIRVSFEYKGYQGPEIGMLHVDPAALAAACIKTGWSSKVIFNESGGHYAAELLKKE